MIGPGWLPRPSAVARSWRRRTFVYTRVRRRARRKIVAPVEETLNHEIVAFDHGPAEFPVAQLRPRDAGGVARALAGDLARWLAARWAWLRPRTVPVIAAVFGMIAIAASADYLAHHQHVKPHVVFTDIVR